jgi:hypothetical protein
MILFFEKKTIRHYVHIINPRIGTGTVFNWRNLSTSMSLSVSVSMDTDRDRDMDVDMGRWTRTRTRTWTDGQMDTDMDVDVDMGRCRCFSTFLPFDIFSTSRPVFSHSTFCPVWRFFHSIRILGTEEWIPDPSGSATLVKTHVT